MRMSEGKKYLYSALIILISLLVYPLEAMAQRGTLQSIGNMGNAGTGRAAKDTTGSRTAKRKGSLFLNDSSKNVYGPNTTRRTTGFRLMINRPDFIPIDTGILNYHRWTYPQRFENQVQDLGNAGTALYQLFPSVRKFSGTVSGFDVYDPYFYSEEPEYYDTKSPYTRMQLVWGGNGRSMTRVEFKRNINPRWNFGFNYRPILVDKQIDKRRKGDRHVTSQYYDFHSHYTSKNDRYQAYGFYRRLKHNVKENGGVFLAPGGAFNDYFSTNASPVLYAAQSEDLKRELNFNHRFRLASALEIYQSVSLSKQQNTFKDSYSSTNNQRPYDNWINVKEDTLSADDLMNFRVIEQEAGFKGRKAFLFYNAFYKFRNYKTTYAYADADDYGVKVSGTEHFLGGRLVLNLDSLSAISGKFEFNQFGNYSLEAGLNNKYIEGSFVQSLSAPGSFYRLYRGVHDFWVNDFRPITGLQAQAFLKVPLRKFSFAPGMGYTLLSDQVWMEKSPQPDGQTVIPVQSDGTHSLILPQAKLNLTFLKKMNLGVRATRTIISGNPGNLLQIPDWLINGQLAFKGFLFKGNLEAQIGFDVSWRSAWFAPGYDPVTQHYYVQRDEKVSDWLGADFFINGKIKRGRFFYKFHNLMQAGGRPGFLLSPGYPGQRTIMDFGFELILFD